MIKKLITSIVLLNTFFITYAQKPQEPKDISSYHSEEISFENKTDNIKLTGTFTYPKNKRNAPAVILISGSGPQDRNSELLGHKPFLIISDDLTKKGIAVLRVDDRGTGTSEGIYNQTGLDGFVRDTKSAIDYLKSRKEVNTAKIGLIGHSLGGVIAPVIAAESKDVAFMVLLAGSGIRGDKLMLLQKEIIERKMGLDSQSIAVGQKNIGGAYEIILKSDATPTEKLATDLETYFSETFGSALPPNQIKNLSKQLSVPWLADFIRYDPAKKLSLVKCPVLALNGSNDTQVPAKQNLDAIAVNIEKSGNKNVTVMELPALNHLFQESETGMPQEYAKIQQTFSPKALTVIADWIIKTTE
ncbi:MAG TPA: alpha/beta fold hydrolase [Flavipsychrobacter sp.]|nr:alpha/beta fold hydrolase [Flavipsychrobacter sp.]